MYFLVYFFVILDYCSELSLIYLVADILVLNPFHVGIAEHLKDLSAHLKMIRGIHNWVTGKRKQVSTRDLYPRTPGRQALLMMCCLT